MTAVLRVFPRRTSATPIDPMAFVGWPTLFRPKADEVKVSVAFTWDLPLAQMLADAWGLYYPKVSVGGPACGDTGDSFTPGEFIREGYVFTSRGCDNNCPWCLVPEREGKIRLLPITEGWIINDNNFLQTPPQHRQVVYQMLARQKHQADFRGGLQASLVTNAVAEELRGVRISRVWLAADTNGALIPLRRALQRLSFLGRERCFAYVLIAYGDETMVQAESRLRAVWEAGAIPFAQLYQSPDHYIEYSQEWRQFARKWCRPAAIKAMCK